MSNKTDWTDIKWNKTLVRDLQKIYKSKKKNAITSLCIGSKNSLIVSAFLLLCFFCFLLLCVIVVLAENVTVSGTNMVNSNGIANDNSMDMVIARDEGACYI